MNEILPVVVSSKEENERLSKITSRLVKRKIRKPSSVFLYYLAAIGMREIGRERVFSVLESFKNKKKFGYVRYRHLMHAAKRVNLFLEKISAIVIKKDGQQSLYNLNDKMLQQVWYEVTLFKCLSDADSLQI